ncbi:MAG: DUF21 domain-containing protein [Thermotogae bacterium]|nr:DUF21 domain-containing protein [Thermotogota bacterium]
MEKLLLFGASLFISALMSSFEMAYVRKTPFFNMGVLDNLLHDRTGILATVLFWNTVALVVGSVSLYSFFESSHFPGAIMWAGVIAALSFAIFGDFIPKIVALAHLDRTFRFELPLFLIFYFLSHVILVAFLARFILKSHYSREEVIDMIIAYLRGRVNEEDLKFAHRSILALYEKAESFISPDGDEACASLEGDPTVLEVLKLMRETGCTRVRLKGGVFDLHEFIKRIYREICRP